MSLRPGWRLVSVLNPMDQGGLIAPLREPRRSPAMHARLYEGTRGRLVPPPFAGPEGAIGMAEQFSRGCAWADDRQVP